MVRRNRTESEEENRKRYEHIVNLFNKVLIKISSKVNKDLILELDPNCVKGKRRYLLYEMHYPDNKKLIMEYKLYSQLYKEIELIMYLLDIKEH